MGASIMFGVHNLVLKYLVTQQGIRAKEYSYISTTMDALIGSVCGIYYLFNEVEMYNSHGE